MKDDDKTAPKSHAAATHAAKDDDKTAKKDALGAYKTAATAFAEKHDKGEHDGDDLGAAEAALDALVGSLEPGSAEYQKYHPPGMPFGRDQNRTALILTHGREGAKKKAP